MRGAASRDGVDFAGGEDCARYRLVDNPASCNTHECPVVVSCDSIGASCDGFNGNTFVDQKDGSTKTVTEDEDDPAYPALIINGIRSINYDKDSGVAEFSSDDFEFSRL